MPQLALILLSALAETLRECKFDRSALAESLREPSLGHSATAENFFGQ